jgi:thioredoxin reductase
MTGSEKTLSVDVLVIGWGKGGKTLAAALAGAGTTVAMVEQFTSMHGGTCINIGCVPTKTLVHDAQERREDDDAAAYWARAVRRRDTLIAKLRDVNHHMLADLDAVTLVDGRARFVGERTVEVSAGEDRLVVTAPTVIVNTGAVPVRPDLPGLDSPHVHDSTSLQHADPFPRRLAVVGAGPIGLEFASMFTGFGAEVTVLNRRARLLPGEDEDVAVEVQEVLEGDGITVVHGASLRAVEDGTPEEASAADGSAVDGATEGAVVVVADVDGTERRIAVDAVLLATGRRPATDDLGLETAGIDVDERGAIVVDEHLRTSAHGVPRRPPHRALPAHGRRLPLHRRPGRGADDDLPHAAARGRRPHRDRGPRAGARDPRGRAEGRRDQGHAAPEGTRRSPGTGEARRRRGDRRDPRRAALPRRRPGGHQPARARDAHRHHGDAAAGRDLDPSLLDRGAQRDARDALRAAVIPRPGRT